MELKEIKKQFLAQYVMSSEKTKEKYKQEIELFCEICNLKAVEDLENFNDQNIELFFKYSQANDWSPSTTNQRLQTAKLFMNWCFEKKIISNNFIKEIKPIRTTNEIHYTPNVDDCEMMLNYIKKHTAKKRLYLMTKLLFVCALRRNEICNLKISDIDKENLKVRVFGKGKKIIEQPVPSALMIEIIEYINTERAKTMEEYKKMGGKDKGFVFVSGIGENCNQEKKNLTNGNQVNSQVFYQQIKRFSQKCGMKNGDKVTPHSLRRASGTNIYNLTGDIRTACEFLRHSNIATTEKCYINYDKQKVVDAVNEAYNEM